MVPVWPGCSTSGVKGGGLDWTADSHSSLVDEVTAGSNAWPCATVAKSTLPLEPVGGNGPTSVDTTFHWPGPTSEDLMDVAAVLPAPDRVITSGSSVIEARSRPIGAVAAALAVSRSASVGTR